MPWKVIAAIILFTSGIIIGSFLPSESRGKSAREQQSKKDAVPSNSAGIFVEGDSFSNGAGTFSKEFGARLIREIVEAKKTGYALMYETPSARELLQHRLDWMLSESKKVTEAQYAKEFNELGLPEFVSDKLMSHVWKVFRASLELEAMQMQYLQAQADFDRSVRANLTGKQYAHYRRFEESKLFEAEYSQYRRYLEKMGIPEEGINKDLVKDVIWRTKAYSFRFLHGPYDGMPEVGLGSATAASKVRKDIDRLRALAPEVARVAADSGLDTTNQEILSKYYDWRVGEMENIVTRILNRPVKTMPAMSRSIEGYSLLVLPDPQTTPVGFRDSVSTSAERTSFDARRAASDRE